MIKKLKLYTDETSTKDVSKLLTDVDVDVDVVKEECGHVSVTLDADDVDALDDVCDALNKEEDEEDEVEGEDEAVV